MMYMVRTQIYLPDELYKRAKRIGEEHEISLAELARRGLELLLDRFPNSPLEKNWELPKMNSGG